MDAAPLKVGDRVKAFHPLRFGVVNHGTVTAVGRKRIKIDFGPLLGGECLVWPAHVLEVI